MTIGDHRIAIDQIDAKLLALLNKRTRHVLKIAAISGETAEDIYTLHRERAILHRLLKLNAGPLREESVCAIYREIISSVRSLQKPFIIAYLGPEATFTHQAAMQRFGSGASYSPQKTITDTFVEVSCGHASYGVVPVENSTEGVVTHTLDTFLDSDLKIVAQIVLPIQHCLLSRCSIDKVKRLFAHPHALAQCRRWLQNYLPHAEVIETSSNASSAQRAAAERTSAAIASALAARLYRLPIAASRIQDNVANSTRFLVIGRHNNQPTGRDRTSLILGIDDRVGALHRVLGIFSRHRINMTFIQSRPSRRNVWKYSFFVDCEGHMEHPRLAKAIRQLEHACSFVKVLGSYAA